MSNVIPTVFASSKKDFDSRLEKISGIAKDIQIDIGDGKFVKFKSVEIGRMPDLRKYKNNFEAHLMVRNPESYLKKAKAKGFKKIIFHYEALKDNDKIGKLILKIKKLKIDVFIAVNPGTDISFILPFLRNIDGVLIMGIRPGRERQHLLPETYEKIEKLRRFDPGIPIEIDGGVNFENAWKLKMAGANYLNSGSLIAESEKPKETIKKLEEKFRTRR